MCVGLCQVAYGLSIYLPACLSVGQHQYWLMLAHGAGVRIRMRVALHVGRCVGGIIGRQNPRYHLFGPQVDIVMKLEPCGTTAGVVVSRAFAALLSSGLGVSVSDEEAHRGQLKTQEDLQEKMGAAWYFSGGANIPHEFFEGFDAQRFCRCRKKKP